MIDENTRLDLRRWFEDHMGPDLARAVKEAMPPLDYDQLARRDDVERSAALTRSELRREMAELRTELKTEMAELRGEMAELRGDLRNDLAQQTRLLVTLVVVSLAATLSATAGLGVYLGT